MMQPTQLIEFGSMLIQDRISEMQLHMKVNAEFSPEFKSASLRSTAPATTRDDLQSLWITEAPELELCLIAALDPLLENIHISVSRTIEESISNTKIFPRLGFTISAKRSQKVESQVQALQLVFGLCRNTHPFKSLTSRSLPPALQDPPEAHAPHDIPCVCIKSINLNIRLLSSHQAQKLAKASSMERRHHPKETGPQDMSIQVEPESLCDIEESDVLGIGENDVPGRSPVENIYSPCASLSRTHSTAQQLKAFGENSIPRLQEMLEFGLWTLFLPGAHKSVNLRIQGEDRIECLSLLMPSVFNMKYREEMKQRATLLSTVSRSLTPMLRRSKNKSIHSRLASMSSEHHGVTEELQTQISSSTLDTALWRIAQLRVSRKWNFSASAASSLPKCVPEKRFLQSDDDIILPFSSEPIAEPENENLHHETPVRQTFCQKSCIILHELLSEDSSILSVGDGYSPTQMTGTTQDPIEQPQPTSDCLLYEWSDLPEIPLSDSILTDVPLVCYDEFSMTDLPLTPTPA
ncbi:hypothetical protein N7539_004969 [Penicillium diatomitis]|uniref:Uncharacterized protein n=1 Tax=Penicillium diatomitis TaxID=2819901 RepID=A0A9X0BUL2_9EURO|nr:uncharacterized protein N7539_004969 [Penicillium diatomitis]KAJ5484981.1 hypothetical protein N7539_004969 [Penicillium diatomitis]